MGLKLKKKMLEQQLAEVQYKVKAFQQANTSRATTSRTNRALTKTSRASSRAANGRANMASSFSFPQIAVSPMKTNKLFGGILLALNSMDRLQLNIKHHAHSDASSPKKINGASRVKSSEVSHQLHQRNTELLTRQRNKVSKARSRLPAIKAPKSGAFKKHTIPPSLFPTAYKRGCVTCKNSAACFVCIAPDAGSMLSQLFAISHTGSYLAK